MAETEKKYFKTRDQATKHLRKMGIAKADYGSYLRDGGKHGWELVEPCPDHPGAKLEVDGSCPTCNAEALALHEAHLKGKAAEPAGPVNESLEGATAAPKVKKSKAAKAASTEPKAPKVNTTTVMEGLIRQGLNNEEVYTEALKVLGAKIEGHENYPGWYRSRMKKAGEDFPNVKKDAVKA